MSLRSATYTVTTADGNYKIGRYRFENHSISPKRIVAAAVDGREPDQWVLQSMPGDKYSVKVRGSFISTVDGKLAAHPAEETPIGWTITTYGQGLYLFSHDGKYIEVPNKEIDELGLTGTRPSQGFKLIRRDD